MKKLFAKPQFHFWGNVLVAFFCVLVLALSLRGLPGNPNAKQLNQLQWKDNGPLELSPERGRYALMYSLVEDHSFTFSPDLARFAAPDVAYTNGKYVSLFAPAVSFIIIPGYLLGKMFGLAQIGAFSVIALFGILNVYLIRALSIRLGAHPLAGMIAGLAFLFASPAYSYAVTLYQHHLSTFLILSALYLVIRYSSVLSLFIIWTLCALSVVVDYPNFFMMLPIGIVALGKTFIIYHKEHGLTLQVPLLRLLALVGLIFPMAFLFWFNNMSFGNPFQLSGTIERAIEVKDNGSPVLESTAIKERLKQAGQPQIIPQKSLLGGFNSRDLLNGFYEHFLSPDRGMLAYTPVMLLGIAGFVVAARRRMKYLNVIIAVIGFNVLLYSMWDDPYGGWAFGSRYLIPTYALLSIGIACLLTRFSKYNLFLFFFFVVLAYSVSVNTLGALTSNRNPPQVEAAALAQQTHNDEPYTYIRNVNLLNNNISKSYMFDTYIANSLSAWRYYEYLTAFIIIVLAFVVMSYRFIGKGGRHEE